MKGCFTALLLLLSLGCLEAQKERNVWPMGSKNWSPHPYINSYFVDFNEVPPSVYLVDEYENTGFSYSLYCDPGTGELLFFSNGLRVIDRKGKVYLNCDSINFGEYWIRANEANSSSHPTNSQGFFIPVGVDSFYFIHQQLEHPININSQGIDTTHYTLLLKNDSLGYFCAIKNQAIMSDAMMPLSVVRHGNGLDWWIIIPSWGSNSISKFILSSSGVHWHSDQSIGYVVNGGLEESGGIGSFNALGTKYAYYNNFKDKGTQIFDFDRCSGLFFNPVHIPNKEYYNPGYNLAFSPNGRFLYVPTFDALIQYDLYSENIPASGDTVSVRDQYVCLPNWPFGGGYVVITMGPDEKMYISPGNDNNCLTVINRPNLRGKACDVRQHGIMTPGVTRFGLPGIINYQLGPLVGSECDPGGG